MDAEPNVGESAVTTYGGWRLPRVLSSLRAHEALFWAVVIFVLALAFRVAWVAYADPSPRDGRFDDSVWYDSSARHLAEGRGYIYDPSVWRLNGAPVNPEQKAGPTAYWPIGYPLVLAALYAAFGPTIVAAKALNVVLGAATAVGVYGLGRAALGAGAGVLGGLVMAAFPSHVMFSSLVMAEVTAIFILVVALYLTLVWTLGEERPSRWQLVTLGVLCAAAAMVRGELVFLPFALLFVWWAKSRSWRQAWAHTGLALVGMALLFVPWTVRNVVQMGWPVVATTGAGGALLQGHFAGSEGRPDLYVMVVLQDRYAGLDNAEREVRMNNHATREALRFALTHPRDELALIPKRLYYLYRQDTAGVDWTQTNNPVLSEAAAGRLRVLSNVYYYVVAGIAVAGAPLWLRRLDASRLLVVLPVAYYSLLFGVAFIGNERYHVPILPFLALAAAASAVAVARRGRGALS